MSVDKQTIFSASTDGAIFCWECPHIDIPSHRSSKGSSSSRSSIVNKIDMTSIHNNNDQPNSNQSSISKTDLASIRSKSEKLSNQSGTPKKFEIESTRSNQDKTASSHSTVSKTDLNQIFDKSKSLSNHSIISSAELATVRSSISNAISDKKEASARRLHKS
jgi:hypothetical protein